MLATKLTARPAAPFNEQYLKLWLDDAWLNGRLRALTAAVDRTGIAIIVLDDERRERQNHRLCPVK